MRETCKQCPLSEFWGKMSVPVFQGKKRTTEAVYREVRYRGPLDAEIMIVGESPGAEEIYRNIPFVGESKRTSDQEWNRNEYPPSRIFYANACRCMILKDKMTERQIQQALACCRPNLERVIGVCKPKLMVLYGNMALKQVLKQSGITKKRGRFQYSKEFDCWVLPTFHPTYCLRDQKHFTLWRPDIAQAADFAKNNFDMGEMGNSSALDCTDVESIDFLLSKGNFSVAIDTETQGLDWCDPNSVVISYSISDHPDKGYNIWLLREVMKDETPDFVIEWERKTGRTKEKVSVGIIRLPGYERKIEELRELLKRPDIKKVMMNGNYDLHRFRQLGIETVNSYMMDIQLAMHAFDPDVYKKCSLLTIQQALLPDRVDHKTEFSQIYDKGDLLAVSISAPEEHTKYAAADAASTLSCSAVLRNKLKADRALAKYYIHLAHPVTAQVLYDIEKNGILFDTQRLPAIKDEVATLLRTQEDAFLALVPQKVLELHQDKGSKKGHSGCVLTRANFLRDVFFSKKGFGLRPLEVTKKTQEPTLSRSVLMRTRETLDASHPAFEALSRYIEWGPLQKLYTTYLTSFGNAVKPDGRLHTQISKTGTATGRTSSSNPNLQNTPKRNKMVTQFIRSLLCAPPGKTLVACDFSQAELRCIAFRSSDKEFIRAYRAGEDIHTKTAMSILGISDKNQLSPEELSVARTRAKACNFGLTYGQHPRGFQAYARDNYGLKISLAEAEEWRNMFFSRYSGLLQWHEHEIEFARHHGFCRSPFGSIRRLPNISSNDFQARSGDERLAINTPIQSMASDMTLLAALEAKRCGLVDDVRSKLVLFIHDELIFEVEDYLVPIFVPKIIEIMTSLNGVFKRYFGFEMNVPLEADASTGKNLAQMVEWKG